MSGGRSRFASCVLATPLILMLLGACASSPSSAAGTSAPTSSPLGPRPASPAVVKILAPKNGATVATGGAILELSLTGATLTSETSQDISPDEGHLHVSVDGKLISMTAGLEQTLPDLEPGRHLLRVEFVAADHLPFDPRVVTQAVFESG
jgi:hypothetical protein